MTLTDRITTDLKAAMKGGDPVKLNTIRSLRAQIIELSKRGTGTVLTPEDELTALLAAAKKRKEAIEMYEKAGRAELVAQETRELEIINTYLPQPMSREEAERLVEKIVAETGASTMKDLPKVMPLAMKVMKGRVEGKVVQEIVRKKLGGEGAA